MAIFPFSNAYVINKDAVIGSSFKAGMVLMQDSSGQVKAADSQTFIYKYAYDKQSSIIGIAAGNSNFTGNTIIDQDVIGGNYLDSNSNFISTQDREFVSIKRQLLDYADETVNEYYNITNPSTPKRTRIAVYPLSGEIFATDQYVRVLHGDYGIDGTDLAQFSPGDLLTFGAGANAGKFVKVNINSLGPDVFVVGVVDKFNSTNGLLYFKSTFYILILSGTSTIMSFDAGNITSYSDSSSVIANDLSLYNNDGTLTNGVLYSSANGGSWTFDGSNDYINIPKAGLVYGAGPKTLMAWAKLTVNTGSWQIITGYGNPNGGNAFFIGVNGLTTAGGGFGDDIISGTVTLNTWFHLCVVYNGSTAYLYLNSSLTISASKTWNTVLSIYDGAIGRQMNPQQYWNGNITDVRLYNRALSALEVQAYYNNTKSRYGL